ncbi:MAG: aldo/keto reductase [Clostridiales bacterium]|jgi:predicted aldo/keto reductase-like oxidoreductase|nr:aldo/keto reductase [Clostridiales bacterium]
MKMRKFGSIAEVSALGFGAMRLPTQGNAVDEAEAVKMIRYAIDNGVNYVDTAYRYHDGESELTVGKALKDGYRSKTFLATKLPVWIVKTTEDYDEILNDQLKRLQTDYIDFYLFHSIGGKTLDNLFRLELFDKMLQAKAAGKIRHIGFSFHDDYDAFVKIIDSWDKWEFCQVQYNYMDTKNQAETRGLEYAASKGIPVIVMEPVLGGKLANAPESVQKMFDSHKVKRAPVQWALDFVWNRPEVSLLLSGMSNMQQLKENLEYADKAEQNVFTEEDFALLEIVKDEYKRLRPVPCTDCKYCLPCPKKVNIPANFRIYNDTFAFGLEASRGGYFWIKSESAQLCVGCKQCEAKCPQKIEISSLMPKVHERLA